MPGRFGNALKFDGKSVIAIPVDISQEEYPDITLTAWVKFDEESRSGNTIFSSGSARLSANSMNVHTRARSHGGPFNRPNRKIQPGEWTFIATSVNLSNKQITMRIGDQSDRRTIKKLVDPRKTRTFRDPENQDQPSQAYVFVGATNFNFQWPAKGVAIDEIRVYEGALTNKQLDMLAGIRSCTASDVAGTYRTAANVLECSATGGTQLTCSYGPGHENSLTLSINDGWRCRRPARGASPQASADPLSSTSARRAHSPMGDGECRVATPIARGIRRA